MRIVVLSDTHGQHRQVTVPDADMLIFAGDMSYFGNSKQIFDFNNWLGELPHKHKICIAGNHDVAFEHIDGNTIITNATYLQDSGITIDGLYFYGSPWQPVFGGWAFNLPRGQQLKDKWDQIPMNTNILITHGPPMGIRDQTINNSRMGCEALKSYLDQHASHLKLHVFGHNHEGYGITRKDGIIFANASLSSGGRHLLTNKPMVIDL